MADAWGGSWGAAWGVSWGQEGVEPVVVEPPAEVNWPIFERRKPVWIRTPDDRLIEVPAEAAQFAISALRAHYEALEAAKLPVTPELAPAAEKVALALEKPGVEEIQLEALIREPDIAALVADLLREQLAAWSVDDDMMLMLLLTA